MLMSLFSRATARFRSVIRLPRFRSSGWSNANCRLDRRLGLMSENRELDEDRLFCQLMENVPPEETGCWRSTFAVIVSFSVTRAPSSCEAEGRLSLLTLVLTPSTVS